MEPYFSYRVENPTFKKYSVVVKLKLYGTKSGGMEPNPDPPGGV